MYEMPTFEDLLLLVSKTMLVPSSEHSEHFLFTMEEIWKDVVGYEGYYKVSNLGRVMSLDRRIKKSDGTIMFSKGKILKPYVGKTGYYVVNLRMGRHKTRLSKVHRLVAEAFIPNPENLPFINHKDETRLNNHVDNLEWCDAKYNVLYGSSRKKRVETIRKKYNGWHWRKTVTQYTLDGKIIKEYKYLKDAEKESGVSAYLIKKCANGFINSCGGFIWKFT